MIESMHASWAPASGWHTVNLASSRLFLMDKPMDKSIILCSVRKIKMLLLYANFLVKCGHPDICSSTLTKCLL